MKKALLISCLICSVSAITAQNYSTEKTKDAQGYPYETVKNDKTGTRIYTLKNGEFNAEFVKSVRVENVIDTTGCGTLILLFVSNIKLY